MIARLYAGKQHKSFCPNNGRELFFLQENNGFEINLRFIVD